MLNGKRKCSQADNRRTDLPQPKIAYIDKLQSQAQQRLVTAAAQEQASAPNTAKPRKARQDSLGGDPASDPWASSGNSQIPPTSVAVHISIQPNGLPVDVLAPSASRITKDTSAYTTRGQSPGSGGPAGPPPSGAGDTGWTSYNGNGGGDFPGPPALGGGFGESGDNQSNRPNQIPHRSVTARASIHQGTGESVTVTMLQEKEGIFFFQHRNYEVKSARRGSSVVRRFSDFVWLLDCLQKRYPFRRLPLLPPKRVQGKLIPSISSLIF
jgi:sorting nexin-8